MAKINIAVEGMHCPSCEIIIKEALGELAGVNRAEASYKKRAVSVDFDEKVINADKIIKAINAEGYKAGNSGKKTS